MSTPLALLSHMVTKAEVTTKFVCPIVIGQALELTGGGAHGAGDLDITIGTGHGPLTVGGVDRGTTSGLNTSQGVIPLLT